jgi:hypothetical protein
LTATAIRVLMVQDSSDDAVLIILDLRRGGYGCQVKRVEQGR